MARFVKKTATGPMEVKPNQNGTSHWICMCGLSKNQPFCDSSHKKTADEGDKTYMYQEDGSRKEVECECDEGHCCCCADND